MNYYDYLSPEELEKYKNDFIENSKDGKMYQVVFRDGRYEIDFCQSILYMPPILMRHNIGKFFMNNDKKICFDFFETCPQEIKSSLVEYYGNGTKGMLFTNKLTGTQSNTLE